MTPCNGRRRLGVHQTTSLTASRGVHARSPELLAAVAAPLTRWQLADAPVTLECMHHPAGHTHRSRDAGTDGALNWQPSHPWLGLTSFVGCSYWFLLRQQLQQRLHLSATLLLGFNLQLLLSSSPSLLIRLPQLTFRISRFVSSLSPVRSARLLGSFLCSRSCCSSCSLCGELLSARASVAVTHITPLCCSRVLYLSLRSVLLLCFGHLAQFALDLVRNFESNFCH